MKAFEGPGVGSRSYQAFAAPEDILVDNNLEAGERRRLLDAWKVELELSGEAGVMPGRPDELLRRVNACRRLLSEEED
jgi:hypothetical protein